jgi:outer membrane lipoprotein LolB
MKQYSRLFFCLSILLPILLAGCSTFSLNPPPPAQACGTTSKAQLEAIKNWKITGALAVTVRQPAQPGAPNGSIAGGNASFNWLQEGKQYTLELFGPFGINHIRLLGSPEKVTLFDGSSKASTATTPEVLLQQQLGWTVPIAHLFYWVRGLPEPNIRVEHAQKLPNGSFSQFTQQGWEIRYLEHMQVGCTSLPAKISVQHPTLSVRLVIKQWQIP